MGNSNSNAITINLNRTNKLYFTDEVVSGTVGLNITQKKLKVNEIYITLTGEVGYRTIEYNSTDKVLSSQQTVVYHHVPFYETKIILARPKAGQKQLVYNQGQYL